METGTRGDVRSKNRPTGRKNVRSSSYRRNETGRNGSREEVLRKKRNVQQELKERRKKVFRQRLIAVAAAFAVVIIWYALTASSYRNRFLPHTYINGHDVGKMSAADVESILKDSVETYSLELAFRGGKVEALTGNDINLTYVSSNEAADILADQNRLGWLPAKFGSQHKYTVSTSFHFDEAKMRRFLESLPEFAESSISKPQNAKIVLTKDQTYRVADAYEGNQPNEDVIVEAVKKAVNSSDERLSLELVEGAYVAPSVTADNEDLKARAKDLNDYVSTTVTIRYKDGATDTIDRDKLVSWITKDEDGSYHVDADTIYTEVYNIVKEAASKYDEYHNTIDFQTTAQGTVNEYCDSYGYLIDKQGTTEKIYSALYARTSGEIDVENAVDEDFDPTFGGTYIEVDVTGQHLYYYKDGKLTLQSDVVTGQEDERDYKTPSGVFAVFSRKTDQILGRVEITGYESHVNYWMPFFESYGMHDAPWRESFGGEIYKTSGSHGCVNLPPDFAEELFNSIETWTPVIVVRKGDNAKAGETDGIGKWN